MSSRVPVLAKTPLGNVAEHQAQESQQLQNKARSSPEEGVRREGGADVVCDVTTSSGEQRDAGREMGTKLDSDDTLRESFVGSGGRDESQGEAEEWETEWDSHAVSIERAQEETARKPPRLTVPNRVNQLEAAELDNELIDMLSVQLNRVFAFFRPSLLEAVQPELEALFRSTVFYFSIWSGAQTPGNYFQNLVFVDGRHLAPGSLKGPAPTKAQRRCHAVLFVLLPWIWARGSRFLSKQEWGARPPGDARRRVWQLVQWLESLYRCATTANLLLFLRYGYYRSVGERALGVRLLPKEANLTRSLNFDYMNQVLLWNSFQKLFDTLRPLVLANSHRFKRLFAALPFLLHAPTTPQHAAPLPPSACGLCRADPAHSPHRDPGPGCQCPHVFCYYCLRSALVSNPRGVTCPVCHVTLGSCERATFKLDPGTRPAVTEESAASEALAT